MMHDDLLKRIAQLEDLCRRQQAQIGQLTEELRRTRNELTIANDEIAKLERDLRQERYAHRKTRENLHQTLTAIERMDERAKVWIRRQFVTSSERAASDPGQQCIAEVLAEIAESDDGPLATTLANDPTGGRADQADDRGERESTADQRKRSGKKRPPNAGGRHALPADLPREDTTYQAPADHPILTRAERYEQIGTATIERLDIQPARIVVQRMTCPVYRLCIGRGVVTQYTCTPPSVIERGEVSDRFLVASAIDKVQDHLPTYRQQQRFARLGVDIPRSKLCRWHRELGEFLIPIAEAIFDEIRDEPVLGIDDTVHRLVVGDRHVCKQGRIIAVSAQSGIFYQFQETREGKWFENLLASYSGAVMGDAYSGHNAVIARDDILAMFCWAHARRKFFEAGDKRRRAVIVELIGRLYQIEADLADSGADGRMAQRRERAGPVLAQIHDLLQSWADDPRVLPKTGIGMATTYVLKRWDGFKAYLDLGEAPIDNNRTERGMRPNALHRKNSLFSASVSGARSYATLLTVTQSAWMHSLNPHDYLIDAIHRLHHRTSPDELTPAVYARAGRCVVELRS